MAGDFNKPVTADQYTDVLAYIRDMCADLAKMLNDTGTANIPANAIRWNSANTRFEIYNGTSWAVLTAKMLMNVDQLDGYDAGNASGNIPVSNGTRCVGLNADKVDGLEAAALLQVANNLADLADAATARSNLGLGSVAVESTLPVAKGGTGSTTTSAARTALGLGDAATKNTATQAEAEAGTLDTVVMTPLKTKQAIDELVVIPDAVPAWLIQATQRNTMFRLVQEGASYMGLTGMFVDEFEDSTGVDTATSTNETLSNGAYINAVESLVSYSTGSNIGTLTAGGGLAAIFNGVTNAAYPGSTGYVQTLTGYAGKNWGSGVTKKVSKAIAYASNNGGFSGVISGNVTLTLQGSADNSSWTDLGSVGPFADATRLVKTINADDISTGYRYHRVYMENDSVGRQVLAELRFYEMVVSDMTIQSNAITAASAPESIRLVCRAELDGTLNTDLIVYVSRDGGTTWTAGTLAQIGEEGDVDYYEAVVDVSGQPSGTSLKYKFVTANDAGAGIHAVALNW